MQWQVRAGSATLNTQPARIGASGIGGDYSSSCSLPSHALIVSEASSIVIRGPQYMGATLTYALSMAARFQRLPWLSRWACTNELFELGVFVDVAHGISPVSRRQRSTKASVALVPWCHWPNAGLWRGTGRDGTAPARPGSGLVL